jgi:protein TonB
MGGIIGSIPNNAVVAKLQPPTEKPRPVRVSEGVSKGMLICKIIPEYPLIAREARISGDVVLFAIIGKNGEIKNLQVVSGHPLLVTAAITAVQHWRYQPYLLNREPVEVETQVTVKFALGGGG